MWSSSAGYEAVGGGAWGGPYDNSDGSVVVIWSAPRVANGAPPDSLSGAAATGWTTTVFNVSGGSEFVHWSAVCAKVGAPERKRDWPGGLAVARPRLRVSRRGRARGGRAGRTRSRAAPPAASRSRGVARAATGRARPVGASS